jgi:ferric-dicitrate binding protein FerR (iron transport regulator)
MKTENIRIVPRWRESKDEIWNKTFESLGGEGIVKMLPKRRIPLWSYAAVLLLAVVLTVHLYTANESAVRGEHSEICLPDGSRVTLNAGSKISYKPFEWFVSRKARLEGEACFEVKSGSRFRVHSGRNSMTVLGTTFNVYARPEMYRVTCLTGRVEVLADAETFVLHSGMQVTCREGKQTVSENNVTPAQATGWMQGRFVFTETPLVEVVAEMERQYDMHVTFSGSDLNHLYTGNFMKTEKPEDVLDIIGRPFGITFNIEK